MQHNTSFWFSIIDFLKDIDGSNVNLTPKGIIFRNVHFESNLPVPNCILIFKYYLYTCKLKDKLPIHIPFCIIIFDDPEQNIYSIYTQLFA